MAVLSNHAKRGVILMMDFMELVKGFGFMKHLVRGPIEKIINKHYTNDGFNEL